jgi:hypothetical protein
MKIYYFRRLMSDSVDVHEQFSLAMYLLKNRIHYPIDLITYWGFSGPCQETHPGIEDYPSSI